LLLDLLGIDGLNVARARREGACGGQRQRECCDWFHEIALSLMVAQVAETSASTNALVFIDVIVIWSRAR
jgi:hypothetical protein